MERGELLELLAGFLLELELPHPLRVAIDGPDGAGKTSLGDELAAVLAGGRPVIRAGIDDFHNPRSDRLRRGPDSPEGYFLYSFNYEALRTLLLEPLGPDGSRRYTAAHNTSIPSRSPNQYALFDCAIDENTGEYLSEDYAFCRRWRKIGGKIWLDTESRLVHIGTHEFCHSPKARFAAAR